MEKPVLLFGETYSHPNIFYRTGFLAPDPVIVVDRGGDDTTLWVSRLEYGRALKESIAGKVRCTDELSMDRIPQSGGEEDGWVRLLRAICAEHGIENAAVDSDFPVFYADALRGRDIELTPFPELYRPERRIKTASEVQAIRDVEDAGMDALDRAIQAIADAPIVDGLLQYQGRNMTGDDLVQIVESRLLELGCSTTGSICCGGPDSADPHRHTSDVIRAGLPIVLDIFPFAKQSRYWGDMTRTVVRGEPAPGVQELWDAVAEAQQAALDMVKPGVNARDIHRLCCEIFARRGHGSTTREYRNPDAAAQFIHSTGHGLGLEIHEFPRVADVDVILQVGDVITIEPGLYDPSLGGVRIEDLVVVTETGCENLTTLPKRFRLGP